VFYAQYHQKVPGESLRFSGTLNENVAVEEDNDRLEKRIDHDVPGRAVSFLS
jgi:hypothetical protein